MNIQKICNEIAQKHAAIIEEECIKVCQKFNCSPQDLILEYFDNTRISIKISASSFLIENVFTFNLDKK